MSSQYLTFRFSQSLPLSLSVSVCLSCARSSVGRWVILLFQYNFAHSQGSQRVATQTECWLSLGFTYSFVLPLIIRFTNFIFVKCHFLLTCSPTPSAALDSRWQLSIAYLGRTLMKLHYHVVSSAPEVCSWFPYCLYTLDTIDAYVKVYTKLCMSYGATTRYHFIMGKTFCQLQSWW